MYQAHKEKHKQKEHCNSENQRLGDLVLLTNFLFI